MQINNIQMCNPNTVTYKGARQYTNSLINRASVKNTPRTLSKLNLRKMIYVLTMLLPFTFASCNNDKKCDNRNTDTTIVLDNITHDGYADYPEVMVDYIGTSGLEIDLDDYTYENIKKRYPDSKYGVYNGKYETEDGDEGDIIIVKDNISDKFIWFLKHSENYKDFIFLYKDTKETRHISNNGLLEWCSKEYLAGDMTDVYDFRVPVCAPIHDYLQKNYRFNAKDDLASLNKYIKYITPENVELILKMYSVTYGVDLSDELNDVNFSFLTKEAGEKTLDSIYTHLRECLFESYDYQPYRTVKSQVDNKFYKGDPYETVFEGDSVTIKNLTNGQTGRLNLTDLFRNFNFQDQIGLRAYFQHIPGEALMDLAVECSDMLNGRTVHFSSAISEKTSACYSHEGEQIILKIAKNYSESFCEDLLHELGHAISFGTDFEEFQPMIPFILIDAYSQAYELEIEKFIKNGNKLYDESINDDNNTQIYCTKDKKEMFAECYTYLMLGEKFKNAEVLEKNFPECIETVRDIMIAIRNLPNSARNRFNAGE